jgi:hypothetical protein
MFPKRLSLALLIANPEEGFDKSLFMEYME